MQSLFLNRKWAVVALAALLSLCFASPGAQAVSMCPFETLISGNGRYVVGIFDLDGVSIWDTDRLWDRLQPTQIHGFKALNSLYANRNVTISHDGTRLAYEIAKSHEIVVHDMAPGFRRLARFEFPRRSTLPGDRFRTDDSSRSRVRFLELSPDGSQLLAITGFQLLIIDLSKEGAVQKQHWEFSSRPIVDWKGKRIAVPRSKSIQVLSLDGLKVEQAVPITGSSTELVAFAQDGNHVIASQGNELRVFHVGPGALQGYTSIKAESTGQRIIGASSEDLWYIDSDGFDRDEWKITPAGPSGEKLQEGSMTLYTGPRSRIIGISSDRKYALVQPTEPCMNTLHLVNLTSRLPSFELYGSKVNYRSKDLSLPHLKPRLGSDLLYEMLQMRSTDFEWSSGLGYHFAADRTRVLLWMASLATALRDRHDAIWFSLLTHLKTQKSDKGSYLLLSELTSILLKLNRAEHLLQFGSPEEAMTICQTALSAMRADASRTREWKEADLASPSLGAVVSSYWPILEAELRLTLAHSFTALGKTTEAEKAYRDVLRLDPKDWRAHAGVLVSNLHLDEATFDALLVEAQDALRLEGWSTKLNLGFPPEFFEVDALRDLRRATKGEAPNSR